MSKFRYINQPVSNKIIFSDCDKNIYNHNIILKKVIYENLIKKDNVYILKTANLFVFTNNLRDPDEFDNNSFFTITNNFEYFLENNDKQLVKIFSFGNNFEKYFEKNSDIKTLSDDFKTIFDDIDISDNNQTIIEDFKEKIKDLKTIKFTPRSNDSYDVTLFPDTFDYEYKFPEKHFKNYYIRFSHYKNMFQNKLITKVWGDNHHNFNFDNFYNDYGEFDFLFFKISSNDEFKKSLKDYFEIYKTYFLKDNPDQYIFNYRFKDENLKVYKMNNSMQFNTLHYLDFLNNNLDIDLNNNDLINAKIKGYLCLRLKKKIEEKNIIFENIYRKNNFTDFNDQSLNIGNMVYFVENNYFKINIGIIEFFEKKRNENFCYISFRKKSGDKQIFKIKSDSDIKNQIKFNNIISIENLQLNHIDLKSLIVLSKGE